MIGWRLIVLTPFISGKVNPPEIFYILTGNNILCFVNPIGAGGHNVPALFLEAISPCKKGSGGMKFPYSL